MAGALLSRRSTAGNPSAMGIYRDPLYGAPAFYARWDDREVTPKLRVINRIATRNRSVDLNRPGTAPPVQRDEIELYVQPTARIPPTELSGLPPYGSCRWRALVQLNGRVPT